MSSTASMANPQTVAREVITDIAEAGKLLADFTAKAAGSLEGAAAVKSDTLTPDEMGRRVKIAIAALKGEIPAILGEAPTAAPLLESRHAAFIAKYSIRPIEGQDSQVAVKVPNDARYSEFMTEAQELSIALHQANPTQYGARQAVWPERLQKWSADSTFQEKGSGIEVITDGCVPGSSGRGMTREGQENLLAKRSLTMEQIRELGVAHTARYILDGQSIFKGQVVRAVGGALLFLADGLNAHGIVDDRSGAHVSSSARLSPSELKI